MVLGVLLAAGAGSRFTGDGHKLRAPLRGRPVVTHALDALVASGLEAVVVVGAVDVDDLIPAGIDVLRNPRWEDGQASSLQVALAEARRRGHDAVVVALGDQPFLTAEAWRAVAAADAPVAVATYDGRRGHPVRLAAEVWPLLPTVGDEVGRALMQGRPELVREIRCEGHAPDADIDTLEDLRRWS